MNLKNYRDTTRNRTQTKMDKNKADNSAIGAELTSHRSKFTFEVKGKQEKKLLI